MRLFTALLFLFLAFTSCTQEEANPDTNPSQIGFIDESNTFTKYKLQFLPSPSPGWFTGSNSNQEATFTNNSYIIEAFEDDRGEGFTTQDFGPQTFTNDLGEEVNYMKDYQIIWEFSNTTDEFAEVDPAIELRWNENLNTYYAVGIGYSSGNIQLIKRTGSGSTDLEVLIDRDFPSLVTYDTKEVIIRKVRNRLHLFVDGKNIGDAIYEDFNDPDATDVSFEIPAGSQFAITKFQIDQLAY